MKKRPNGSAVATPWPGVIALRAPAAVAGALDIHSAKVEVSRFADPRPSLTVGMIWRKTNRWRDGGGGMEEREARLRLELSQAVDELIGLNASAPTWCAEGR